MSNDENESVFEVVYFWTLTACQSSPDCFYPDGVKTIDKVGSAVISEVLNVEGQQSEALWCLCVRFPVRVGRNVFRRVSSADRVCWFVVSQCESVTVNSLAWLF